MHDEEVKKFFQSIQKYIGKAVEDSGWNNPSNNFSVTSAWSIINYKSSSNSRHIHSNNYLSAAYYVKAPKNCGDIVFYDPRPHVARGYDMRFRKTTDPICHTPKTGDLLVFPSYLYHSVRPANHTRISCALDLYLYNDD